MMKYKLIALTSLLLLAIALSGCAAVAATPTPAATETPTQAATEAPAVTEAPVATQGFTQDAIQAPAATEAPTQAPTEAPATTEAPQEVPAVPLFPVQKPPLVFTGNVDAVNSAFFVPSQTADPNQIVAPNDSVGFVFPSGPAIKAAGAVGPNLGEGNLTRVGMVQVADGAALIAAGIYVVEIDLTSTEAEVAGRLVSNGQTARELKFHRTALVRNPDRAEDPSFPAISPIIASDAVCFVVGIGKQNVIEVPGAVNRYCSGESVDTNQPILSVKANFPDQYNTLITNLSESVKALRSRQLPENAAVDVLPELTISEIEGHSTIKRCNDDPKQCNADIIGAPSASFWHDYDAAQKDAGDKNFVVTEGFVRVAQPLEIPGQQTVQPGSYWIRDWFDPQGKLIGTALLGWTDSNELVNGLTIAATPTYFLEASGQRQVVSWISGWHCFRWCKWQSRCP